MKNLLISLIFILFMPISYAQNGCIDTSTSIKLIKANSEEVTLQLCYSGTADYLILTQCYDESSKFIPSAEVGNYLLSNKRLALFTTDNSRFHFKFVKEEKIKDTLDECSKYIVYSYYEVTRSKLRLILLGPVETIEIIGEDSVEFFEITYPEAVMLYQMVYGYFKWKKWQY